MKLCPNCQARIHPGVFHSCGGGSFSAPWIQDALAEANKPLLNELSRIRALLEAQTGNPTIPKGKAHNRETR